MMRGPSDELFHSHLAHAPTKRARALSSRIHLSVVLWMPPQARQLIDWWVEGRVNPHVPTTQRLPLSRADDAFTMIAARKTTGKVVLVP